MRIGGDAYIGILGGIGVGFSAQYGWQAVFNTFGALAIAAETYGLQGAVSLRAVSYTHLNLHSSGSDFYYYYRNTLE